MPGVQDSYAKYSMVTIPPGVIDLRDDRIKRTWTTRVNSFSLGSVPVTQALYFSTLPEAAEFHQDSQLPVVNVSWIDVITFCNVLSQRSGLQECYSVEDDEERVACDWNANGYRLPTEAEWQYACQAGTVGYRYGELDEIAWYHGNADGMAHEVGQKQPNAWGLHDMLGNVWEWCWDLYDTNVYGSYRIFRGGSWAEEARGCGATCRRRSHPKFHIDDLGFRLARSF